MHDIFSYNKVTWSQPGISLNTYVGPTVIATLYGTTTYIVTGEDADGSLVKDSVTIQIEIPCNFAVPNVFTPTKGGMLGMDKKFYINDPHVTDWSISIYDCWGVLIYKSNNPFQYWEGNTPVGGQAPTGVYYYLINGTCDGRNFTKEGFVQLIR